MHDLKIPKLKDVLNRHSKESDFKVGKKVLVTVSNSVRFWKVTTAVLSYNLEISVLNRLVWAFPVEIHISFMVSFPCHTKFSCTYSQFVIAVRMYGDKTLVLTKRNENKYQGHG